MHIGITVVTKKNTMRIHYLMLQKTLAVGISLLVLLTSCGDNSTTDKNTATDSTGLQSEKNNPEKMSKADKLTPAGAKPAWGKDMTDPMTVVIEKLSSFGAPPLTTLSAPAARKQPSPADAAMGVIKDHNILVPPDNTDTTGKDIAVAGGTIHARIYTPKTGKSIYPVIVYYHGGGWVIADLNTYGASAQGMAEQADAVVVSVAYRQAPEHKFPTAHNDCYAAYEWAVKNAASVKGDSRRIALVGESAGGNLAAAVSMMARDKKFQMPVHEVLVYPIAGYDFATASYKESDSTKPLSSGLMKWFFQKYLNSPADGKNPMISPVTANVAGLPATTIIAAEYDPLRSEGELLRDNFKKAGVAVNYKLYKGVTHEFFGMAAVLPEAKDAQGFAADELKKAFNK
jgi:acetyl esterase/lipase